MNAFRVEPKGPGHYILCGELTFDTVPAIWREQRIPFEEGQALVIDLQQVDRADSAGLALLMEWLRTARREKVDIRFTNVPAQMLSLARVSSLEQILPIS